MNDDPARAPGGREQPDAYTPEAEEAAPSAEPREAGYMEDRQDADVAERILSALHVNGFVPRDEVPEMMDERVRAEVERRLASHGLALASSPYSGYYAIRLSPRVSTATSYDWASNLNWDANCYALLVILWMKFCLPRRVKREPEVVGADTFFPEKVPASVSSRRPASITYKELFEEFGRRLGGKIKFETYLRELKRRGFIDYRRKDTIMEGPMLELMCDGELMASYLRESLIPSVLEKKRAAEEAAAGGTENADRPSTGGPEEDRSDGGGSGSC